MELETRLLDLTTEPIEIRAAEGDNPARLIGYAAVFHSLSADLGGFKERVIPGAFKAALSNGQDIRALVDHDPYKILGRTSAGTLRLAEDAKGLRVEIDLPDTSYARDLMESVKRRDIRGMSFGFRTLPNGDRFTKEGNLVVRELTNLDLREVTATSLPAYGATSLSLRVDPGVAARIAATAARQELAKRQAALRHLLAEL